MTTVDSLPPECLELVLTQLQDDPQTLSSVMRVNKLLFRLVVPILYSDPFSLCPQPKWSKLYKVLLDSVNPHIISSFLETYRGQCGSLSCTANCRPYKPTEYENSVSNRNTSLSTNQGAIGDLTNAAAATTISTKSSTKSTITSVIKTSPSSSSTTSSTTTMSVTTASKSTMARYMDYLTVIDGSKWIVYASGCMSRGNKQLTGKFFLHILTTILKRSAHRIVQMVFLPAFIGPITLFASRMRSLTQVKFEGLYNSLELGHIINFLRARQGYGNLIGAGGPGLKECNLPELTISQDFQHRTYSCHHLHHHHAHHHHVHHHHLHHLHHQTQHYLKDNLNQFNNHSRIQQLELIDAMGRPISLNTATYRDFPFISHAIPCHTLSQLERFKHVHGFLGGDGGGFLSRCRALKELEFASFDKNAFTWAEDEKKQLTGDLSGYSIDPPSRLELLHLVQLKVAKITVTEWMVGQVLRSITTGFSHSLEDLHYTSYNHSQLLHILCSSELVAMELNAAPDVGFCIDSNFRLWKLKRLRLVWLTSAITIGQGAFQSCPNLENLYISGPVTCTQPFFDTFRIPKLKVLELGSGPSKFFRIESLEFSPLLESLNLLDVLPPEREHLEPTIPHPISWTWTMPYLTTIKMSGRPSYYFRFEWIRYCPSLHTLAINGISHEALQIDPQDIEKGRCGLKITKCELQIQTMRDFDNVQVAQILEIYCSRVTQLKLIGSQYALEQWRRVDLGLAMDATKNLLCLEKLIVYKSRDQDLEASIARYGLVRGTFQPISNRFVWCKSLKLKPFLIEVINGGQGCNFFRQLVSPSSSYFTTTATTTTSTISSSFP